VTRTNFPSSLSENYAYDADNNLTSKTDRKGQTITYLYDALNRLTKKQSRIRQRLTAPKP
jgi:YD repeat-containing protein